MFFRFVKRVFKTDPQKGPEVQSTEVDLAPGPLGRGGCGYRRAFPALTRSSTVTIGRPPARVTR